MKAMILAAGFGTRLKPLTDSIPKALVQIKGIPLIEIIIKQLVKFGYNEIIINLHHFGEQIVEFIKRNKYFGIDIQFSDESEKLLDTGGAILNAKCYLDDNQPFLVYNVDVVSDIDLNKLLQFHIKNSALATLAVRDRKTNRKIMFDSEMQLCQWINTTTSACKISREPKGDSQLFAFSGIQIIDPQIFNYITEKGAFSVIDLYIRLAKDHVIKGYMHNSGYWFDMGKFHDLDMFNQSTEFVL
jgi:NDP-sugar pyrophosphorylase family protein